MEKRKICFRKVNPIGMGCMGLSHGYGDIPSEAESIAAIRKAHDFGCEFYDTAEAYSPMLAGIGHNERILGKALDGFRNDIVLATKLHLNTAEVREKGLYETIEAHLTASMERLRTDHVDLYYLHRVNRDIPVEEVAEAMQQLISKGMISGWGMSQVGVDTIRAADEVCHLSAVQNIYSMVERSSEADVLPYLLAHDIALVPFSPVASGFLSGKVSADTDFSHRDDVRKFVPQLRRENIEANQPLLQLIQEYAERKGATNAQISLAWMLKKYPNVIPIPGSKNAGRILENLGAWNVTFTDEEFTDLDGRLNAMKISGFRGHIEFQGGGMAAWGKKEK